MAIKDENLIQYPGAIKAGQRLVKVGNTFMPVGVGGAFEPGSGTGGGMKFYKCASVDTTSKTWSGYELSLDDGNFVTISNQETTGLIYSVFMPAVGEIWSEDAMLQICKYSTPITFPTDFAFNLPLDDTSNNGEQFVPYPNFGTTVYCPGYSALTNKKVLDGVTCLYFGSSNYDTRLHFNGQLFAKDDTTTNETTGCSARYGVGHPWTYSFWLYPDSTDRGETGLFMLGYHYSSGYDRRLVLRYRDTDGKFDLFTDSNDSVSAGWSGYAETKKWHHICVTGKEDARTFSLYIDGSLVSTLIHPTQDIPSKPYKPQAEFLVGSERTEPGGGSGDKKYTVGGYAKLKWYNRALDTGEIVALSQEIQTA